MKKITLCFMFVLAAFALVGLGQAEAQCVTCSLSGPSSGRPNQTLTYTVQAQANAQYFWSTTGNLRIQGSPSSNQLTIRNSGSASGKVCVARYISSGVPCTNCRDVVINNCTSANSVTVRQLSGRCPGDIFTFRATPSPSVSGTYSWISLGGTIVGSSTGSDVRVRAPNDFFGVSVTFTTRCNNQQVTGGTIAQFDSRCIGGPFPRDLLSPNPAGGTINVPLPKTTASTDAQAQATIYDSQGNPVLSQPVSGESRQMDIRRLAKGTYYLQVTQEGKVASMQRFVKE